MDGTKCKGDGCPVKEGCHRFTAHEGYWQAWFMDSPSEIVDGKFVCNEYWGDNSELIWKKDENT
jgi:hypothetical protein